MQKPAIRYSRPPSLVQFQRTRTAAMAQDPQSARQAGLVAAVMRVLAQTEGPQSKLEDPDGDRTRWAAAFRTKLDERTLDRLAEVLLAHKSARASDGAPREADLAGLREDIVRIVSQNVP